MRKVFAASAVVLLMILVWVPGVVQPGAPSADALSFSAAHYGAGTGPGYVTLADVNGDGNLDIVVASEQSNDVTVLLGDGKGRFRPADGSPFPAGHCPNDIAVGDFNGDKHLDLAIVNHDTKEVTLLLGDGRGTFKPAPTSPLAVDCKPHAYGIAAGDFNGDGNLDLVVDSWEDDKLELLFGDGKGGFRPMEGNPFRTGRAPCHVAIGDVNGDGIGDVAVVNLADSSASLFLATKQDRLVPGPVLKVGKHPYTVALGDLNGDGKADIVTADHDDNSVTVLLSK